MHVFHRFINYNDNFLKDQPHALNTHTPKDTPYTLVPLGGFAYSLAFSQNKRHCKAEHVQFSKVKSKNSSLMPKEMG